MSLIYDRPNEPLRVYFDAAIREGIVCHYCGGPLSLPIIRHEFIRGAAPIWMHPQCAMELCAFLGGDIREALDVLNAHAAIRRESSPRRPHPEVA